MRETSLRGANKGRKGKGILLSLQLIYTHVHKFLMNLKLHKCSCMITKHEKTLISIRKKQQYLINSKIAMPCLI